MGRVVHRWLDLMGVWLDLLCVCPIILSVYESDYIRLTSVRLFYPSIVQNRVGRMFCKLSEFMCRLSDYFIGLWV